MSWTNPESADLQYDYNNGVVAVRVGSKGALVSLARKRGSDESQELVWVFCDSGTYTQDNGDVMERYQYRGIRVGTREDWKRFKRMCEEVGVSVACCGMYVPCSNGQRNYGQNDDGRPMASFTDDEIARLRFDLPTRQTLMAELAA